MSAKYVGATSLRVLYCLLFFLVGITIQTLKSEEINRLSNFPLPKPILSSPFNGSLTQDTASNLYWYEVQGADSYEILISTDSLFETNETIKSKVTAKYFFANQLKSSSVYFWKVRAFSGTESSEWSDVYSFETVSVFPDPPIIRYPTNNLKNVPTNFTVHIEMMSECDRYEFLLAKDSSFFDTVYYDKNVKIYYPEIRDLQEEVTYYIKMRSIKGEEFSKWQKLKFHTVNIDSVQPLLLKPKNGDQIAFHSIYFEFTVHPNAYYFDFQVSRFEDFNTLDFTRVKEYSLREPVKILKPNTRYYWRARVGKNNRYGLWSKTEMFNTIIIFPTVELRTPINSAEKITPDDNLIWTPFNFSSSYQVQLSTDTLFNRIIADSLINNNAVRVSALKLDHEKKYFWRVRGAFENETGPWSLIYSFKTRGKLPEKVKSNTIIDTTYIYYRTPNQRFMWFKAELAESYMIQISSDSNFSNILYQQSKIKDTSVCIWDIKSEFKYWRVRGENSWGAGPWSETVMFNFILPVKDISSIPKETKLLQNYPNPFNPSTKISYSLSSKCHVSLVIYDLTGKVTTRLVNKTQDIGSYELYWEPKNISAGIYYYCFQAGRHNETKKLVYIK